MEVWKNKATGDYFIYLREEGDNITLITPMGDIKTLDYDFFEGPFHKDEKTLIDNGLVKQQQIEKYQIYIKMNEEEQKELLAYAFEGMTPSDIDDLLNDLIKLKAKGYSFKSEVKEVKRLLATKYPKLYRRMKEVETSLKTTQN